MPGVRRAKTLAKATAVVPWYANATDNGNLPASFPGALDAAKLVFPVSTLAFPSISIGYDK